MTRDVSRKEKTSLKAVARIIGIASRLRSKPFAAAAADDTPGSSTTEVNSLGFGERLECSSESGRVTKHAAAPTQHGLDIASVALEASDRLTLAVANGVSSNGIDITTPTK